MDIFLFVYVDILIWLQLVFYAHYIWSFAQIKYYLRSLSDRLLIWNDIHLRRNRNLNELITMITFATNKCITLDRLWFSFYKLT